MSNKTTQKKGTISVLGLGYMGLPLACLLANANYKVQGIDIDKNKIEELQEKKLTTTEPGLKELFNKAVKSDNLSFHNQIQEADVFIIAVPTPSENKKIDLKYVESATKMVLEVLQPNNLVIIESTIAPNTCKKVIKPILDKKKIDYKLAHCPERAIPGNTLYELINNDRILGGIDKKSTAETKEIYASFVKGNIFLTDITTAETVKLLENSFRDINIAFANEVAKLSEKLEINPWETIKLANKHPRVNILNPGPGVGGHCIPVDPWFLVQDDPEAHFIRLAREVNDSMPAYVIKMVKKYLKKSKSTITILGVAYKANVDDARETPAEKIIKLAKNEGWKVKTVDPYVKKFDYPIVDIREALSKSDAAILITDHNEFKKFDFSKFNLDFIFDARNVLNKKQLSKNTKLITFGGKNE